jgi:hypothetical protein
VTEPTAHPRTERVDFRATSDPALHESADRGEAHLLTYRELYALWERQQWAVQDLDFTQDRADWHERFDAEERAARMYGLSSFFIGEQRVAVELGPIMRAVPDEDMRVFLGTQIADEARHVMFFDRFYSEVGILEADELEERLERVYAARYGSDLDATLAELPGDVPLRRASEPRRTPAPWRAAPLLPLAIGALIAVAAVTGAWWLLWLIWPVVVVLGPKRHYRRAARY